MLVQTINMKPY